MLRRIAVAVDFSDESGRALEHALVIARRRGAALVLVHVATTVEAAILPDAEALPAYQQLVVDEKADSRRRLDELAARHAGEIAIDTVVVDGFPDTALGEIAEERDAELIAIGTHGRTGLGRALLGSVAEKVVRVSRRDVLVARGDAPTAGYRRILVPTDFSPRAERTLEVALDLAADDAEVVLFHAWQLPGSHYLPGRATDAVLEPVRRSIEDAARVKAAALLDGRPERAGVRFEVTEAAAGRAIEDRAAGCDLIVMGSHGRRGFRRWLLGSLAESTVRSVLCTVVVVRGDEG